MSSSVANPIFDGQMGGLSLQIHIRIVRMSISPSAMPVKRVNACIRLMSLT